MQVLYCNTHEYQVEKYKVPLQEHSSDAFLSIKLWGVDDGD